MTLATPFYCCGYYCNSLLLLWLLLQLIFTAVVTTFIMCSRAMRLLRVFDRTSLLQLVFTAVITTATLWYCCGYYCSSFWLKWIKLNYSNNECGIMYMYMTGYTLLSKDILSYQRIYSLNYSNNTIIMCSRVMWLIRVFDMFSLLQLVVTAVITTATLFYYCDYYCNSF